MQAVLFYVLPEGSNDLGPRLFLDSEDFLQPLAYTEALGRLVEPQADQDFECGPFLIWEVASHVDAIES